MKVNKKELMKNLTSFILFLFSFYLILYILVPIYTLIYISAFIFSFLNICVFFIVDKLNISEKSKNLIKKILLFISFILLFYSINFTSPYPITSYFLFYTLPLAITCSIIGTYLFSYLERKIKEEEKKK